MSKFDTIAKNNGTHTRHQGTENRIVIDGKYSNRVKTSCGKTLRYYHAADNVSLLYDTGNVYSVLCEKCFPDFE